ncbi:hypothetical protein GGR58DRAFT_276517 [Xylaria digitata]|nr:hypothetical protein GGR58DRAFT_276517 [Xylaria digitata]
MSAPQDWPLKCECQESAPFRFIALLGPNGDPDWSQPGEIHRGATCKEFRCKFWYPWDGVPTNERDQYRFPEGRAAQQQVGGIGQRSNFDGITLRGNDAHVGDAVNLDFNVLYNYSTPIYVTNTINLDFNFLQNNSIPVDLLLQPDFATFVENSAEIADQRRRQLMSIMAYFPWMSNFG